MDGLRHFRDFSVAHRPGEVMVPLRTRNQSCSCWPVGRTGVGDQESRLNQLSWGTGTLLPLYATLGGQDMTFKAILLGSAAALAVPSGAQAADLFADAVDYVRVCDAFGTGYWYIPG